VRELTRRLFLACRPYQEDLKILIEIVTIVLVAFYAYQAWWQSYDARLIATATHVNAVKDLRAYISVGAPPDYKMAEIKIDPKTGGISMPVYFFNGGRTPAHHFMANIRTHFVHAHDSARITLMNDIKRDGPHIERFVYFDNLGNSDRSNSGGFDIAANSPHRVEAHIIDMSPQDRTDIQNGGGKIVVPVQGGTKQYPFLTIRLFGTFEYCDEFGGYHCNELDLIYDKDTKTFGPGSQNMDVDCNLGPVTHVPYRYKSVAARILTRCEQPAEEEQAQREADQNAGKKFPVATP
jgi:hypothetical protein